MFTTLETGDLIAIDGVKVIRSVSDKERDSRNASRVQFNAASQIRNFTVAIETATADGMTKVEYDTDISVEQFVATKLGPLASRFQLLPDKTAAVSTQARAIAIRPLAARDGSDKRAIVQFEGPGASQRGLFVSLDLKGVLGFLGSDRTKHLTQIGEEGFIDRAAIVGTPTLLDPNKPLEPGQKRYTTAVQIGGHSHLFEARPETLLGVTVIDARRPAAAPSGTPSLKAGPR